jgi:hypothetical protein
MSILQEETTNIVPVAGDKREFVPLGWKKKSTDRMCF